LVLFIGRQPDTGNHSQSLIFDLLLTGVCRLVLNTARRFAYPFAPALSRAMGVPLTQITSMIAVNQASGLLALFFGPFADRLGYRFMMLLGLLLLAIGMLAAASLPFFAVVLVALFLAGLGKNIFDPAIQAYVGERVPYEKRGLVIGLIETSWAASTLIGIPLVGFLIAWQGWRAPFAVMGIAALAGMVLVALRLPPESTAPSGRPGTADLQRAWGRLYRSRTARTILVVAFLVSMANDCIFVIYGAWLEENFHLSVTQLGLGSSVIGIAELCGEFMTVGLADRMGKPRALVTGIGLSMITYLALPWTAISLPFALTGLLALFIAVEFTFVTALSMATEILPDQRATMMSGMLAVAGMGRMAGAITGGFLWVLHGATAVALLSAFLCGLAVLALTIGLRTTPGNDRKPD
jgi:MFS transporter, DHA1 family, inner membrane transport protein